MQHTISSSVQADQAIVFIDDDGIEPSILPELAEVDMSESFSVSGRGKREGASQ
jgi:hypothetical protein